MKGSITVELTETGNITIDVIGELKHIEVISALTMALHNIEFQAMALSMDALKESV